MATTTSVRPTTARPLAQALLDHAASMPNATAAFLPSESSVREVRWREIADDVTRMVALLGNRGVGPGDCVALWSDNRYEWILADLAMQLVGAINVPLHGSLTAPAAAAQIAHSEPRLVVIANTSLADSLQRQAPELYSVLAIELLDATGGAPALIDRLADRSLDEGRQIIEQRAAQFDPESIATILYTSGTSGEPKGVALTHANLTSNTRAIVEGLEETFNVRRMNFLPFSHIYARTCDFYAWLLGGSQIILARSRDTIVADCGKTQPTMINGVPFFYQRLAQKVAEAEAAGKGPTLAELFGGDLQLAICGGAPLPVDTFDFYHARGVMLLAGYGLTESSPVITMSLPTAYRRGSSGKAIPGIEVRFAEDGELLTRGPHVMKEYWKNPELTRETIRDGWLHTGDLGAIDADGYITITGRKKELLVLSTGKKATPTLIEGLLVQEPLLAQAMVIGNDRPCLAALIVPNFDMLRIWAAQQGLGDASPQELVAHPSVVRLYAERIAGLLGPLPNYEQVKRFALLDSPFTIDGGHLTPKQSLRRNEISRDFAAAIAGLYADGAVLVDYPRRNTPERIGDERCDLA
jgi:long-chain acyl-CoA synthetase